MVERTTDICAYLDESIPELRGELVHFTGRSAGNSMRSCMSRREALRMAYKVIELVQNSGAQGRVVQFGETS